VAQAAQMLAGVLPITEEQALTLVKSGFTNLEGLRDADVQDFVDILDVDQTRAQEIHAAAHREDEAQKKEPQKAGSA
jgi:transcription termination factor NusA